MEAVVSPGAYLMCIMNRCHMIDTLWLYILPRKILELEVDREKHNLSKQQPGGSLTSTACGFVSF